MKPTFMSPEHVAAMNLALAGSAEVREACRALARSGTVHYRLSGGPDGFVDWTVAVSPDGLSFGLESPTEADVVIESGYAEMVRSARAAREDRTPPTAEPPVITGDTNFVRDLSPVLALARSVATVEVEFPDV